MEKVFWTHKNRSKLLNFKNFKDNTAHAYLILGPQNIGKTTYAEKIAEIFLYQENQTFKKDHPDLNIFTANTGSVGGLQTLNTGLTDIAFSHLLDPQTGDYNTPYLRQYCPDQHPVVVNMFYRQVGFLIVKAKANIFKGWDSLTNKKIRFINRQAGSGIRMMLDNELKNRGISSGNISGYENEVYTHFEVGLSLMSDEADVGIASAAVAKILDLHFQPLISERFDMILDKNTFFQPVVQTFIETLQSDQFKNRVGKIGNYDFKDAGRILHS